MPGQSFSMSFGSRTPAPTVHCRARLADEHGHAITEGSYYGTSVEAVKEEIARDAREIQAAKRLPYVDVDCFCSDPRTWNP